MSPLARSFTSKRLWRVNISSMWLKNGMPVSTSALPAPSRLSSATISVSFVLRSVLADRPIKFSPRTEIIRLNPFALSLSKGSLFFKPRLDRARVIVEAFQAREPRNLRRKPLQRPLLRANHAHALEKIVRTERREKSRAAARRQHVVRPRHVIAQRRSRVRPDEQRAGVSDRARPALRLAQNQFDVLGCYRVR